MQHASPVRLGQLHTPVDGTGRPARFLSFGVSGFHVDAALLGTGSAVGWCPWMIGHIRVRRRTKGQNVARLGTSSVTYGLPSTPSTRLG